jgi:hypothetical protein
MTTIVTRSGKGSPLTHTEVDTNFTNLNTAKLETAAIPLGTLQAPSVSFLNDSDTGIFCPQGGNSLAIATGGQYAITCSSTQAVGIKTANPQGALQVAGSTRIGANDATDAFLEIGEGATGNRNSYIDIVGDTTYTDYGLRVIRNNTGANATSELKHRGTGALNFTTEEAAPIVFYTTNSPALTITSGGLVGIGSTVPNEKLTVADSGSANVYIALQNSTTGTTSADGWYLGAAGTEFQIYGKENGPITFSLNSSEKARIDTSGRLLVGTSTARANFFNTAGSAPQQFQVEGATGNTCSLSSICSVADTSGGRLLLAHQRSGAVGGNTILNSGDQAGYITFQGNEGGEFVECASIEAVVDGTPGANDMPGRLVFSTNPGSPATSPTERMRITSDAYVRLASGTGGIQFNGDTAADNALDDYEEGTWEPTISGDSTAGTGTYTFQLGAYTKVGRLVTVQAKLGWTAHTGTGGMLITNLPFSTFGTNGSSYACGSVGYFTGLTVPASNIVTLLVQHAGSNYILIVNTPVGGGDSSQTAMDTAVAEFFFSATYMTAT